MPSTDWLFLQCARSEADSTLLNILLMFWSCQTHMKPLCSRPIGLANSISTVTFDDKQLVSITLFALQLHKGRHHLRRLQQTITGLCQHQQQQSHMCPPRRNCLLPLCLVTAAAAGLPGKGEQQRIMLLMLSPPLQPKQQPLLPNRLQLICCWIWTPQRQLPKQLQQRSQVQHLVTSPAQLLQSFAVLFATMAFLV